MKREIKVFLSVMLTVISLLTVFVFSENANGASVVYAHSVTSAARSAQPKSINKQEVRQDDCIVCSKETSLPYLCKQHMIIAIALVLVIILNFIPVKINFIKMMVNSVAVLGIIIIFSSLYTDKMFIQAKVCLAVLGLFLIFWIISVIRAVNFTEEKQQTRHQQEVNRTRKRQQKKQ
ncbi:MAG: hypothetical protein ACI4II_07285 [Acutalibacteraceae bacterium]